MALNAFLHLKGQKQGDIKGSVVQKGKEGTLMIIAANHEVMAPAVAVGSGASVGKRIHRPFAVTKELDKSSPMLYQAMVTMETMAQWQLDVYAPFASNTEKLVYTVQLFDAIITDIRFVLPNTRDADSSKLSPYEVVEFTYQSIQWTWQDTGVMATDKWM